MVKNHYFQTGGFLGSTRKLWAELSVEDNNKKIQRVHRMDHEYDTKGTDV